MKILNHFNTTVEKALSEIDPKWRNYPGLIVCGTHTPENVEALIEEIQEVRVNRDPFLGICFGHQLAAVEYARNVMDIDDATSEEFGAGTCVVQKRKDGLKVGLYEGETYWNNYEVDPGFVDLWEKEDNFITCQYHPEYQSSKDKPHPLLVNFLEHAKSAYHGK